MYCIGAKHIQDCQFSSIREGLQVSGVNLRNCCSDGVLNVVVWVQTNWRVELLVENLRGTRIVWQLAILEAGGYLLCQYRHPGQQPCATWCRQRVASWYCHGNRVRDGHAQLGWGSVSGKTLWWGHPFSLWHRAEPVELFGMATRQRRYVWSVGFCLIYDFVYAKIMCKHLAG